MPTLAAVNKFWDKLVHDNHAQSLQDFLKANRYLVSKGLRFGGRAPKTFLKADFKTPKEFTNLESIIPTLLQSLDKAVEIVLAYPGAQDLVRIPENLHELMEIPKPFKRNTIIARLDGFVQRGQIRFLECNSDSPAGTAFADYAEEALLQTEVMKKFQKRYKVIPMRRGLKLAQAFLETCRTTNIGNAFNIGIIDWEGVETEAEFYYLKDIFESLGVKTFIGDPRDLDFNGKHLRLKGHKVDVIYKRVLTREIAARKDEVRDFIKAAKSGKVIVINPFQSALAGYKGLYSLILDEKYKSIFEKKEREIVRKLIPFTFKVEDADIKIRNRKKNRLEMLEEYRQNWVLKPCMGHGGHDVYLGRECTDEMWKRALKNAMDGDWVAQEYVDIPEEKVPVFDPELKFVNLKVNSNPFAFNGRYGGGVTRLSESSIINVTAGGGVQADIQIQ